MNNWKNYTVNIGHVKQETSKTFTFESNLPLDISRVQPSCAECTKFIDYKDNILTIKYNAPQYPIHLRTMEQVINKEIEVYYNDGTQDKLKFVGFLKR